MSLNNFNTEIQGHVQVFTIMDIINRLSEGQRVPAKESMRYELLRFCTFRKYPSFGKPSLIRLAKAGFYYASNRDEVVCYCCATRISNWKENDDPMLAHEHVTPDCCFLLRNSEVNFPVSTSSSSDVIQRLERLENDPEFISQVFNGTSTDAIERINNQLRDCIRLDGGTDDNYTNMDVTSDHLLENRNDGMFHRESAGSLEKCLPLIATDNRKDTDRPNMTKLGHTTADGRSICKKMKSMTGIMVHDTCNIPYFVNTKAVQPSDDSTTNVTQVDNVVNSTDASSKYPNHSTSAARIARFRKTNRNAASDNSTVPKTVCCGAGADDIVPNVTKDQCRITQTGVSAKPQTLPSSKPAPLYTEYSTAASRIASFGQNVHIAVQIEKLCDAGFFYLGSGDETRCFFCGIGLCNWADVDDPMKIHARFSSKCSFVVEAKG
ncbi:uncharacterized protein LOC127834085 [Dreissena polymorpha]|uniref:Uncharacterized protein n=1 Tax=Dreissena polymorpha TaxID=45954 RepID=A0A9D4GGV2_DREPO|nr:uncharacterized protein LOC127834085 [Dreissena polymorpha]XP_052215643.1 uncharacterized protein LOC127834085 [Dreissena polymorpha]XP_052215645.1 uncharacterized protein LOC127834085 [Dreissena polymorpha]XP_052215646.1 uncharacterized protein LOC127834085 [Dreissena polymorpha]KAH3815219.1 hypothetical protein DPMN_143742 [Dreissena polymorpha]